jgi:hypothetical protein
MDGTDGACGTEGGDDTYRVLVENPGRPRGHGLIILNWILKGIS